MTTTTRLEEAHSRLTERQLQVLRVYRLLKRTRGFPPTGATIAELLGMSTSAVHGILRRIRLRGVKID